MKEELYIGLMSGTSVDSIDAVLIDCDQRNGKSRLLHHHSAGIDGDTRDQILGLCQNGSTEIERMGELDRKLGHLFADACIKLLDSANTNASRITAIGSHGQTIRHRPPTQSRTPETAFTCQIGDPNTIAEVTGITTVADFRRRDIAAGGQAAPLVPRFHQAAFTAVDCNRAIVNIGGMANVTVLEGMRLVAGYDTGPGNVLLDGWNHRHQGERYDNKGSWAATGAVHNKLLELCLQHPYFQLPPPKSTGRETFNLPWLEQQLEKCASLPPQDVQATLLELSARSICQSLNRLKTQARELYVCGGGAHNMRLMQRIATLMAPIPVNTTAALGIAPDWVEASAFAWLASQTLNRKTGNSPLVTGAHQERILGGIYYAG